MDDFKAFPTAPTRVELSDGTALEIGPVKLGQIPRLVAAVRPLTDKLNGEPDWLALLLNHGDAVLELLAICTRRKREWVDELTLDDAVRLCTAVFEVNVDFFVAQVAPAIQGAVKRFDPILRQLPQAGTPPWPASSAPGTATPM